MVSNKTINAQIFYWSMLIGLALSLITFISNWLGLIHREEIPTAFQLFDISFYYFAPLVSWAIITLAAVRNFNRWVITKDNLKPMFLRLLVIILLLSPIVRMFDILVDYTIKNLLGMINVSPFKILNDVWLVVLFSTPSAFFKMLVIAAVVYLFKKRTARKKTLTVRTGDGSYNRIDCESISYLQASGNYLNIRAKNEEYRTRVTLKSLESTLGDNFYRIHKSTIVNWNHIKQLKHWRNGEYLVIMTDDKPLTSSKSYKSAIDAIKIKMASVDKSEVIPDQQQFVPA